MYPGGVSLLPCSADAGQAESRRVFAAAAAGGEDVAVLDQAHVRATEATVREIFIEEENTTIRWCA